MRLLTRTQVIEYWSKQTPEALNSFVCPNCRDVLVSLEGTKLTCPNIRCMNGIEYVISDIEKGSV